MTTATLEKGFHTYSEEGRDITFRNAQQSWYFYEIRDVKDRHGNTSKVRVKIRRANHDDYSDAEIQVWSPSNGWLTFHTQGVESLPVSEVSYVTKHECVVKPFMDSAEHLWLIVGEHFGR